MDPETLTDLERALRFLYLQKITYGGKVSGKSFSGSRIDRTAKFNINNLQQPLAALHARLANLCIENLDYADFIRRYDSPTTLFYLDPPYVDCEKYYDKALFERQDHARLAEQLCTIKGRFILSINDTPEIRELYKTCTINQVATKYSAGKYKETTELIIQG